MTTTPAKELKQLRVALFPDIASAVAYFDPKEGLTAAQWKSMEQGHTDTRPLFLDALRALSDETKTIVPKPAHLIFFREHFDLSQEKAARLLGVTRVTWNRWEKGHTPVPIFAFRGLRDLARELSSKKEKTND